MVFSFSVRITIIKINMGLINLREETVHVRNIRKSTVRCYD